MRFYHVTAIALTLVGLAVLLPPETEVASVPAPVLRHVKPRPVPDAYFTRHMVDRLAAGHYLAIGWYAVGDERMPEAEEMVSAPSGDWCLIGRHQREGPWTVPTPSELWARIQRIGEQFSD